MGHTVHTVHGRTPSNLLDGRSDEKPDNPEPPRGVIRIDTKGTPGGGMSLLKRLLGRGSEQPKQRTRICVECGMPIAEHKDWCSILRGQLEMKLRSEGTGG